MLPRKKRIIILTSIIAIIILIISITFIFVYLNTDMLKSNKTLFLKYMEKNTENFMMVKDAVKNMIGDSKLQTNPYNEQTEIKVNYTKNMGTTSENTSNVINKLKLVIDGNIDQANNYDYKNMKLLNGSNQIFNVEYIQNDTIYGIKFSDLFKQYILVENNNLKDLFKKIGYTDEQLANIPNTIAIGQGVFGGTDFTEEEIKILQDKYLGLISQDWGKDKFSKKANQAITINQKNVKANAYSLKLTKEQLNNMYIKILENLKSEDTILSKIDKMQNKLEIIKMISLIKI